MHVILPAIVELPLTRLQPFHESDQVLVVLAFIAIRTLNARNGEGLTKIGHHEKIFHMQD